MATVNPWLRFSGLLPAGTRYTVMVDKKNTDGTSTATKRDGTTVLLIGDIVSSGKKAWVQDRHIIGEVTDLPEYVQQV